MKDKENNINNTIINCTNALCKSVDLLTRSVKESNRRSNQLAIAIDRVRHLESISQHGELASIENPKTNSKLTIADVFPSAKSSIFEKFKRIFSNG